MDTIAKEIPSSEKTYKPSQPFGATVLENRRLTSPQSSDDVRHIVFDIAGSDVTYIEGQSIGVVPPGEDTNGKKHRLRLYSIASSRKGDDQKMHSVSLAVKRVVYRDEQGNLIKGVASNYLCDSQVGDKILITGPVGRTFVLPKDISVNLIMIAVGTGIAPFRAFIHEIYRDHMEWGGQVYLFYGAKTGLENLYQNEENNDIGQYMDKKTFKAFSALSRASQKKRYVHHELEDNLEEIWTLLKEGNFSFYLCGMKKLEKNVNAIFERKALKEKMDWETLRTDFKKQGRWNIEVY